MYSDAPFQLAHTGTGGMTSSLSVGIAGSAAVRRLKQFPLSPVLVTGRSDIKVAKIEDPRFSGSFAPDSSLSAEIQQMVAQQMGIPPPGIVGGGPQPQPIGGGIPLQ